jgi:type VII secretion integral membrane protein EccD
VTQIAPARRVTIVAPRARVDVALPVESTVAELVPALVRMTGADSSAANVGWVLARLDGAPIEAGHTVSTAGLHDGDIVYLRPREPSSGPLFFDDVIDAIASVAEARPGSWTAAVARRCAFAAAVVAFVGITLLIIAASSRLTVAAGGAAGVAVGLLVAAGALARAYGDADAGAACATGGLVAAFVAGFAATPDQHTWTLRAGALAMGLAAVALYAVLAAALLADRVAELGAVAVAAGFGAAVAATVDLGPVRAVSACAVAIPIAAALCSAAPMIALRLGRLPLPRVPSDVEAFRADEESTLSPDVVDQTTAAERILTGLLTALGAVVVGCAIVLLRYPSQWAWALAGLAGLVWVLRSRAYAGAVQRAALVAAGVIVLAGLGVRVGTSAERTPLLIAAAVVALIGIGCLAYAARVIRGRRSPHLARLLDVSETLGLIALLPVAAAVIDVYHAARGLGS